MNTSDTTTTVTSAIANAVRNMSDPKKNARNSHFRNEYADLGAVLDCIRGPLDEFGLLMMQATGMFGGQSDIPVLVTRITHIESGEWVESIYPLNPSKSDPQGLGAALTYARRYSLKALFGMVDEDDDGETASGRGRTQTVKVEGFDNIETAKAAASKVTSKRLLEAWSAKVQASGFRGEDRQEAARVYRELAKAQENGA